MKKGNEKENTKKEKKTTKKTKQAVVETKIKKNNKEKKENIFKRIFKYFKGVFKETKRIRWTEGKDLVKYSLCTVVFVILLGVYFYAIDWVVLLVRSLAN